MSAWMMVLCLTLVCIMGVRLFYYSVNPRGRKHHCVPVEDTETNTKYLLSIIASKGLVAAQLPDLGRKETVEKLPYMQGTYE